MNTKKFNDLIDYIKELKTAAIAYSGGVDSTFLLKAAKIALGDNVIALTIKCYSIEPQFLWGSLFLMILKNIKPYWNYQKQALLIVLSKYCCRVIVR